MTHRPHLAPVSAAALTLLGALTLAPVRARAATGICDANPPISTDACIAAIQNGGTVVNDIFKDANGLTGPELPVFGKLFNNWPNCPDIIAATSCAGQSLMPYDCPGQYVCDNVPPTFAAVSMTVNGLDRRWAQPCRWADTTLVNGCPKFAACIADGVGGNYVPWEGLVFDLGGPSNKVAIFAQNDHGPQPCESLEYTVYLTDNPFAVDLIQDPRTTGVDPQKWNRAVLSKIFTKGWVEVRPPDPAGHATCGDTPLYSVEEDSFAQVFSLPCGITFRYASIIAGNDGLDFPECAFDSDDAELDAVAGLTESGAAVCPDADGDLFVDCSCPGAPTVCDCNDGDPVVHPGAPEACDSPDVDCDMVPGSCSGGLTCYQSLCLESCGGENPVCSPGASCTQTPPGKLCVPQNCTAGGCPPGGVCSNGICVPACTDVICPGNQVCQDGQCIDPCKGVQCPNGQVCQLGQCEPPCDCFAGDAGCASQPGTVCDTGNSSSCVPEPCKGVTCKAPEYCNPQTGTCAPFCHPDVKCPAGQKCVEPTGCVPLCTDVNCPAGLMCNPATGSCEDASCAMVTCFPPQVCKMGVCVDGGEGGAGGGTTGSGTGGSGGDSGEPGGCGCRVGEEPSEAPVAALLGVLLAAGVMARRRR